MSCLKFLEAPIGNLLDESGTSDALNNRLVDVQPLMGQYSAQPEVGANTFPMTTLPNHALFQSAQPDAYPLQFGTVTNYAMSHGSVNVQLPHRWDQPQGAINIVNPSMSPQMNFYPLAKPGSSQSSNISNADLQKKLKKQESDRKSRAKKEEKRKENEEKLDKVTLENNDLRKDIASLKEGEFEMKKKLKDFEKKLSDSEKEVSKLNNKVKGQKKEVEALSEKLVASSEAADLVRQNKKLKRKIELLMTQLKNPDSMKIVELHEENENLKRKAKILQVINEALCDKVNNDEQ